MNNPDTEKSLFIPGGYNNNNRIIITVIVMMMMMPFHINGTEKGTPAVHHFQSANVPNISLL